ncbi:MAG TPA: carboxypeptidase-like regulatory domain-containing protein [Candidatus Limnocylindrales bacterium]|nr:carboxypeptidase-like regulatory domain-containing protein [Candidatus Limnocylindrales bacterium]
MKRILHLVQVCALGLLLALTLSASEHRGVVKFGGIPVPGVTVTATQGDKTFTAVTDDQGMYAFPDLADGVWKLHLEMLTFAPQDQEIAVAPNAPVPEWNLKLLSMSDIHPTAAPPPAPTPAAATGTMAAAATATNTPAAASTGGTPQLQAGAPPAKGKNAKGKKGATQAANPPGGFQRTDVNANGGAAASAPAESVSAQDQQNASDAMVVNGSVSTGIERRAIGNARRGIGSLYRGDVGLRLDNSYLDARPFSLTGQDTAKPTTNHFGAQVNFGGPLTIPHLLHGNGQFFISYGITRNRTASTVTNTMPTDAERNGDFSSVLSPLGQPVTVYDPQTGAPFPNSFIPQNRWSSQALALLKFYPEPNFVPTAGYNYQTSLKNTSNGQNLNSRLNRNLDRKNFVNGGVGYSRSNSVNPSIFGFTDTGNSSGINANATWRHLFSQRVNLVLGYQFSRSSQRNVAFFENKQNVSGDAGIAGNNQEPVNWGPPSLSFNSSGISGLADGAASLNRNQTNSFTAQMLWVKRPHNLTFGGDVRRQQFNYLSQQNARGGFGFNGGATQAIANGVPVIGTGSDFADFLLGIPDTVSLATGNADKYFRANMDDFYITDDWRVATGLTVNIGMRWEYGSPLVEKYGRLVNLDVTPGFGAAAAVVGFNPVGPLTGRQYPDSLVHPDKIGYEPRLSFAWHPLFGSSLVVRGGYGVYYNTGVFGSIANRMAQQSPLSKSLSLQNTADPATRFTMANGFNAQPSSIPNTFGIDPFFRPGYSQNWQVSAQRDLTEGIVMTVTYVGIKGTRQEQEFLPNTYAPGALNPCLTCPVGFVYMQSNGNSTREEGDLQLQRRFHNGFSATAKYAFSKSIDDAAVGGGASPFIAQNWLNLSGDRALSTFDQRHLFTLQAQYSTGVGVKGGALMKGWRGAAFKGWTVTTDLKVGSGLPLSPFYPSIVPGTAYSVVRPNFTGADIYAAPAGLFLNPLAFTAPIAGQWGTAGRDSITGPGQFSLNANMSRTFKDNLDVNLQTQNALNHVVYTSYNTTITSLQFGLPASANGMRTVQLSLRWRF